ncbi:MAG: vitamin K epoxide reductase family protein, partial [Actinomycetota bacterium]
YAGLLLSAAIKGERAAVFGLFVALVGTLYSAYLTYLELFVIQAICQWCVASAGLIAASLLVATLRIAKSDNLALTKR